MTLIPACITKNFFEKVLRNYFCDQDVHILNYTNTLAVTSADSYNSNLIRSSVSYCKEHNDHEGTVSLIIKCCPDVNSQTVQVVHDMNFFGREIQMYSAVLPEIHKVLGNLGTLSAKYVHSEKDPLLIVIEDLSEIGFEMMDRRQGLDLEHCKIVVKKLAQLHAASIIVFEKQPNAFSPFTQALLPGNVNMSKWILSGITEVTKVCEKRSDMNKFVNKLERLHSKIIEKCEEATQLRPGFNVLNHGDCWTNNVMFQYDAYGKLKDARLVDYQIGVYTSPAIDLHYFWVTSPTIEVRKQHLTTILDYYYNNLLATMSEVKHDYLFKIPTKENFLNDWYSRMHYSIATVMTVQSLIRCENRDDACVSGVLDPKSKDEGSFWHHIYNNSVYWEHMEYLLNFYDKCNVFDS